MPKWDRTQIMQQRLEDKLHNGLYAGRRIIHRDSPIDGRVSLGAGYREAVLVDSGQDPYITALYKEAYQKANSYGAYHVFMQRLGFSGHNAEARVISAVYRTVRKRIKGSKKGLNELIKKARIGNGQIVPLGFFIKAGKGVCRHMAPACGVLLELFRKAGYIKGKISIDRNTAKTGHAWCRYTNSGGEVYILDVAQDYIGRLEKAKNWDYRRPDERA